jgi:radical SAM superfamily enzyme YgiQ (UPF0313 family)
MTDITLVNTNLMRPPIGPIGLDYLAEAISAAGYQPTVLDLSLEDDPEAAIRRHFKGNCPLAVGLTIRNTDDCYFPSGDFLLPQAAKVIGWLKEVTDAPLVAGGVGFSVMPAKVMEHLGLELGIRGDGEHSLPALLKVLEDGRDFAQVPNLLWRKGGKLVRNRCLYPSIRRMAASRRFVNNAAHFRLGGMGGIETKRGCNMGCFCCADPLAKGRRVRLRDARLVADEVEALLDQGVDHLHLCDSEFNLPHSHAVAVLTEWVRRGFGSRLAWYGYLSPVPFPEELASLMLASGCRGANFGVDHLDDAMLARLGRKHGRSDVEGMAAICRKVGLNFMIDLLLGSPGETEETARTAIEAARGLGASRIGIAPGMRIYPGTRAAAMLGRGIGKNPCVHGLGPEGLLKPVFYVSEDISPIVPTLQAIIGKDERFFLGLREETDANYNYNDNEALVRAIKGGMRGAYWDILRRLVEGRHRVCIAKS